MPFLSDHLVVPVVVLDDAEQAKPLGEALLTGGIDVVEVTLRTAAGLDAIERMSELPGLIVGAGSVLGAAQVAQVAAAGARFVVSPGVSAEVVGATLDAGLPALPGVATASELMQAVALGLDEVKFFPAGLLGGPPAIKALAAPFPGVSFMPSGGVSPTNLADYLALPMVPAISGSWMVERALLADGRWDEVTRLSAEAVAAARSTRPGRRS